MADIETLWNDHAEWSQATFGPDCEIGPVGPLKHLQKEAQEAIDTPGDILELADCLLLLLDATRRNGFSFDDLVDAADHKLHAVLKARTYPKPNNGEPSFHVKESTR